MVCMFTSGPIALFVSNHMCLLRSRMGHQISTTCVPKLFLPQGPTPTLAAGAEVNDRAGKTHVCFGGILKNNAGKYQVQCNTLDTFDLNHQHVYHMPQGSRNSRS